MESLNIVSSRKPISDNSTACILTALIMAATVVTGSSIVIAGYALHSSTVIWLKPGLKGMSLFTAVELILLGVAVVARHYGVKVISSLLAATVIVLAVAILTLHVFYGADVLSLRLDTALGYSAQNAPQVSFATAFCCCLLGIAVLVSRHAAVADILGLMVIVGAAFALLGYAYDVEELYALPLFKSMALHTAASLLLLSVAGVLLRPQSDWCVVIGARTEAGAATRRQLAIMAVPVLGGAILIRIIVLGGIGAATALALLVAITVISLTLLILRDGRRLTALEEVRHSKDLVAQALHAQMMERLAAQEIENVRRNAEYAQAQSALFRTQRLEALSRLTGSIAHDFNNLLQAIGGSLDLLPRRVSEGKPVASLIDRAKSAVRRGAQLGNQLLAFSHTQKLDIRLHALDELLEHSEPMVASALGPAIDVHYDRQALGMWIMTDRDQFTLALLNIALNARDAMRGGGRLTVKTEFQSAAFPNRSDGVLIQISDTGEGMTDDVIARATEPFFSTKPEGTATGLGLSQVTILLRQCGAQFGLHSQLGQGTTLDLVFPVHSAPVAAAPHARVARGSTSSVPLILVVEDDEAVREVLVGGLSSFGYGIAEARDGASGIALLQSVCPSVAVIDYLMPDMNGAQVARRARITHPNLPIIFVSGHFETAALEEFPNSTILRKPFALDDLHATLTAVLH